MNNYKEEYEKYKNSPLPEIGQIFNHPTQKRGTFSSIPIKYRVVEWLYEQTDNSDRICAGNVETVHSGHKNEKTLHWIRKMYNKSTN